MILVQDLLDTLGNRAPFDLAESWDNVGLLVGSRKSVVQGVIVALDASLTLLDEALAKGCNVLLVHHPVIFQPLKRIDTETAEGRLLQKALAEDVAIIACHTNFDSTFGGVSDYLAAKLGLTDRLPLLAKEGDAEEVQTTGIGSIGHFKKSVAAEEFMNKLLGILALPGVQIAGPLPEQISRVALCGGSGSDFAGLARQRGADLYITAEIKHNVAIWAVENSFCIIDGSHYATEKPAMQLLADHLASVAITQNWKIPIMLSDSEKHPFTIFCNKQAWLDPKA